MHRLLRNANVLFVLFLTLALVFAGCNTVPGTTDTTNFLTEGGDDPVLTQRQIQILSEVGLPVEYEKLSSNQKNDIMVIEQMLSYLDKKYDCIAEYVDFVRAGVLNSDELTAKVNGYVVTVFRKYVGNTYVFEDNYAEQAATESYEKALGNYFESQGIKTLIFAEIDQVGNDANNILNGTNGAAFVFVVADMSADAFKEMVDAYAQWYAEQLNGTPNTTRFYLVDEMTILDINRENYEDCLQEVAKENRLICMIHSDGSISIQ